MGHKCPHGKPFAFHCKDSLTCFEKNVEYMCPFFLTYFAYYTNVAVVVFHLGKRKAFARPYNFVPFRILLLFLKLFSQCLCQVVWGWFVRVLF